MGLLLIAPILKQKLILNQQALRWLSGLQSREVNCPSLGGWIGIVPRETPNHQKTKLMD